MSRSVDLLRISKNNTQLIYKDQWSKKLISSPVQHIYHKIWNCLQNTFWSDYLRYGHPFTTADKNRLRLDIFVWLTHSNSSSGRYGIFTCESIGLWSRIRHLSFVNWARNLRSLKNKTNKCQWFQRLGQANEYQWHCS